jgi:hypothetical protein
VLLPAILGGIVGAVLSIGVPKVLSTAPQWVPRWFGWLRIAHVRTAAATVGGLAAAAGISLSISDHSHKDVTYIVWYGIAGFGFATAVALSIVIDRRPAKPSPRREVETSARTPNDTMNRLLGRRWLEFRGARAARDLTSRLLEQSEAIKSFSTERREIEPHNDADARTEWWRETARLFNERLASETRLLLEDAQHEGLVSFDRTKIELFRLGRANAGEIEQLAQLLYNAARREPRESQESLSDADRRRIVRGMEGRLARGIHDPTLLALDKRNKEKDAERQRELIGRGEDLKRRVGMERTMIERTGRQTAQEHMLKEWTDAARDWGAAAGLATEPPPIGFSLTGQPAAQRKALEKWIGECLDALRQD